MPLDDKGEIDVDRGIRQFVVGTGGVGFEERPVPRAFSEKLITHQYGVLRMKLLPNSYEWEFLAAPSGDVLDRGAGGCRKASYRSGSLRNGPTEDRRASFNSVRTGRT